MKLLKSYNELLNENKSHEDETYDIFHTLKENNNIQDQYGKLSDYIINNDVNIIYENETLLTICVINNHLNLVKLLIENGADINLKETSFQSTPLLYSASNGYIEITNYLIENGADLNLTDENNETALIASAKIYSQYDTIRILLNAGAKLTYDNQNKCFIDWISTTDPEALHFIEELKTDYSEIYKKYEINKNLNKYKI